MTTLVELDPAVAEAQHIASRQTLRLREATADDRERLWEFISGSGLQAAGTLEPGSRFWLMENGEGRIVASTGIEYGSGAVLLRSTAVDRSLRHRGLALAFYEFRFAVAMAEGYRVAYGFCDTPSFMLRTGWRAVSVQEVVDALPDSHQVRHFDRIGWLPNEHAFRRDLVTRWDERP